MSPSVSPDQSAVPWSGMVLVVTVLKLTREEWRRFVSLVPRHWLFFAFLGGATFFLVALYWVVIGFALTSGTDLYAWHRNNPALIGIGINFFAVTLFGIGAEIALGGLLVARRVEASALGDGSTPPTGPS